INARRNFSDRFIPRRANANFDLSYYYIQNSEEKAIHDPFFYKDTDSFVNTAKHFYNLRQYRTKLWKTMMPEEERVLIFSSPKKPKDTDKKYENPDRNVWPVCARTKPLIGPPSIVLDMPDLDTNIYHHVVDWGKMGYIGTIYEREVHLWHPEEKLRRHVTKTGGRVQHCVKWNRKGTLFAMAMTLSGVCVWDCNICKAVKTVVCTCSFERCTVTAIEWTRDNSLITGCSEGGLCWWSPEFLAIKMFCRAHASYIINIKVSCNENYLVTSGIDKVVRLWKLPEFKEDFEITMSRSPVKSIAWHPWRDSLMVLAGAKCTTLWNINARKPVRCCRHPYGNSIVDSLTFNPLSGELVVSYYALRNHHEEGIHFLTVLKDLDDIVDEVQFHVGRVPYLLWDAQGTKLGT
ncbi:hypothetical protein NQ318_004838, partial [Aromia moschata]